MAEGLGKLIGIMVPVFTNGSGDQSSIPGQVIPKSQKMIRDTSLLNTQNYQVWIKGKWSHPWKGVVTSCIPWCSSYRKGSLKVALGYRQPTYNTLASPCRCGSILLKAVGHLHPIKMIY